MTVDKAQRPSKDGICIAYACERRVHIKFLGLCIADYHLFRRTGGTELAQARRVKANDTDTHKVCSRCSEKSPRSAFNKSSRNKDGLKGWCRPCGRAYAVEGYAQNREAILARQIIRQRTPEYVAYRANYKPANPAKARSAAIQYSASRRALLNGAFVDEGISPDSLRARHGDRCEFCNVVMLFAEDEPRKYHPQLATVEHMIPLSRDGMHSWDNTRLSCHRCNTSKRDKTPEEFRAFMARDVAPS